MGCGPSQVEPGQSDQKPLDKPHQNGVSKNGNVASKSPDKKIDKNSNNPVPKSIAFTVTLDGEQTQNKLLGPPPPRLKRLDPLNVPTLTAEQLAEKQRLADEKREQQIKRKQSASLKQSRRRQQILEAQKFGQEQETQEIDQKIKESLASAGKSREAKLKDVQEKQRIRQERARRAREKVRKLNQLDDDLDIEVEKDDNFNDDDVDSWLDGDNNNNNDMMSADSGDRIYSGRASPKKRINRKEATLRRGISANTVDSFDNAYNRKPPSGHAPRSSQIQEQDDFFDS